MNKQKTLIIGLDGVPLHLVQDWVDEGHLPNLKRLMDEGSYGHLNSTTPHTSGPAWSSFMTGKNPGKTGIYDFLYRQQGTYDFIANTAKGRAGKAVWEILSDAGKQVIVVNVPLTYPVDPINGAMLSGWMTPYGADDYYYPPTLLEELEKSTGKYTIYPSATFSEDRIEAYFDASHKMLEMRTNVALALMQRDQWDFMMMVYFDTDRILHQTWHHLEKSTLIRDYFDALDASIGRLLEEAGDDVNVLIMSDHGMGPTRNMIVLNTWLLQKGLIKLKNTPCTWVKRLMFRMGFTLRNVHQIIAFLGLAKHAEYKVMYSANRLLKKIFLSFNDVDWSRSKVYSFGRSNGPIFLNVKGREPKGIIEPGEEYERVRAEVAEMCKNMKDPQTGDPLVGELMLREEVYSGPYLDQAPDIMLEPYDERDKFYGLSDFGANKVVSPMYRYSGMHRQHGLLILHGPEFKQGAELQDAQIIDVAPTILHAMTQPVPKSMDGRPLLEAFQRSDTVEYSVLDEDENNREEVELTEEQMYQLEERMRKLGYLG